MLAYSMLGTNDNEKAHAFYDALMGEYGAKKLFKTPGGSQFYGKVRGQPMLCVGHPYDKKEANVGNGVMVAIHCETTDEVDKLYAKAMSLGASDEGEPGWRVPDVFYGGYFRDLDGNKLCFCKMNMG